MARLMAKQQQPKRLGAPSSEQDKANEMVEKYSKLLRDYQNVVFAVVVLILTVGVLSVWHHQRSQEQEDAAWLELGKAREAEADKLEPLVKRFEGTNAHPFLVLALASKLYDKGEKADLEKAKALLERAQEEVAGNRLVSDIVADQLKGVKAELGDARFWTTAPVGSGSK
jgi:hypothetical protein